MIFSNSWFKALTNIKIGVLITSDLVKQKQVKKEPKKPTFRHEDIFQFQGYYLVPLYIHNWGCKGETGSRWLSKCIVTLFWGRICRHVENGSPKTVPQCTWQPSRLGLPRNLKVANMCSVNLGCRYSRHTFHFKRGEEGLDNLRVPQFHSTRWPPNENLQQLK